MVRWNDCWVEGWRNTGEKKEWKIIIEMKEKWEECVDIKKMVGKGLKERMDNKKKQESIREGKKVVNKEREDVWVKRKNILKKNVKINEHSINEREKNKRKMKKLGRNFEKWKKEKKTKAE